MSVMITTVKVTKWNTIHNNDSYNNVSCKLTIFLFYIVFIVERVLVTRNNEHADKINGHGQNDKDREENIGNKDKAKIIRYMREDFDRNKEYLKDESSGDNDGDTEYSLNGSEIKRNKENNLKILKEATQLGNGDKTKEDDAGKISYEQNYYF